MSRTKIFVSNDVQQVTGLTCKDRDDLGTGRFLSIVQEVRFGTQIAIRVLLRRDLFDVNSVGYKIWIGLRQ